MHINQMATEVHRVLLRIAGADHCARFLTGLLGLQAQALMLAQQSVRTIPLALNSFSKLLRQRSLEKKISDHAHSLARRQMCSPYLMFDRCKQRRDT